MRSLWIRRGVSKNHRVGFTKVQLEVLSVYNPVVKMSETQPDRLKRVSLGVNVVSNNNPFHMQSGRMNTIKSTLHALNKGSVEGKGAPLR